MLPFPDASPLRFLDSSRLRFRILGGGPDAFKRAQGKFYYFGYEAFDQYHEHTEGGDTVHTPGPARTPKGPGYTKYLTWVVQSTRTASSYTKTSVIDRITGLESILSETYTPDQDTYISDGIYVFGADDITSTETVVTTLLYEAGFTLRETRIDTLSNTHPIESAVGTATMLMLLVPLNALAFGSEGKAMYNGQMGLFPDVPVDPAKGFSEIVIFTRTAAEIFAGQGIVQGGAALASYIFDQPLPLPDTIYATRGILRVNHPICIVYFHDLSPIPFAAPVIPFGASPSQRLIECPILVVTNAQLFVADPYVFANVYPDFVFNAVSTPAVCNVPAVP